MKRYLISGGAGFIGSHLVQAILSMGDSVVILDNFSNGTMANLEEAITSYPRERMKIIEGDICDLQACHRACEGIDFVLHQAAMGSITRSVEHPALTHANNTTGTLNMLIASRDAKVKRFVYASSSSVYGSSLVLPRIESDLPQPISPYSASKLAGEHYTISFYRTYGLETVNLRYFNVFGPRQNSKSQYAAVVPCFIDTLLRKEQPVIYGDGDQSRDFTYVENVVLANLLAITAPREACGKNFNIACGRKYSINHLYDKISNLMELQIEPRKIAARVGDVRESQADISQAEKLLGYKPKASFEDGLRMTVRAYVKNFPDFKNSSLQ